MNYFHPAQDSFKVAHDFLAEKGFRGNGAPTVGVVVIAMTAVL